MLTLIQIKKSDKPEKKYMAIFEHNGYTKTTHFGDSSAKDYIIYNKTEGKQEADIRKSLYLLRHRKNENWSDPTSAGSLSRFILWNKETFEESLADYKRRFKF